MDYTRAAHRSGARQLGIEVGIMFPTGRPTELPRPGEGDTKGEGRDDCDTPSDGDESPGERGSGGSARVMMSREKRGGKGGPVRA